jgi:DNA-binding response OmpR family regulator
MIKILHVDDSKDDADITRYSLKKVDSDIEVEWLNDPGKLNEQMLEESYDAVLCDFQMPKTDGLDLLKMLREDDNDIPFFFLTGQGNEQLAADALEAGANDYFTKEIGIVYFNRLVDSIKLAVENARSKTIETEISPAVISLVEQVPESVFAIFQHRLLFANESFVKTVGAVSLDQIVGREITSFISPENFVLLESIYKNQRKVQHKTFPVEIFCIDGESKPMIASIARMNSQSDDAMLIFLRAE